VLAGVVTGWATAGFFYFNASMRPFDMHEGVLGLMVHVPVLIVVSLLTRPQDTSFQNDFFPRSDVEREVA
jgi:SSS family solute:Na+ symporter